MTASLLQVKEEIKNESCEMDCDWHYYKNSDEALECDEKDNSISFIQIL